MTHQQLGVYAGVDTHAATHHAAVVDVAGRPVADREFPATAAGFRGLAGWVGGFGVLVAVGVEGTGSYGAGLARYLAQVGLVVVEVDRPDRRARRARGKSDPLDAYAAALAVCSGRAAGVPKSRDGLVESLRMLRVARSSAVKARTQAFNQIQALLITGPVVLREQMAGRGRDALVAVLARLRPGMDLADPVAAAKHALRGLARRHQHLQEEIEELDQLIAPLVAQAAPVLLALFGVGPECAAQLVQTAGDNPQRMRSEAGFAHLCGVAPLPASSGKTRRHRLNRGGDRQANKALYTIVLTRLGHDPRTRAYAARRTAEGLSKKDIIRCLKRYVAREVYRALTTPPPATTAHQNTHTPTT
jgi:transposase